MVLLQERHDVLAREVEQLRDEHVRPLRVLVAVGRRRLVTGPGRGSGARGQTSDELLQPLHVREDELLAEARRLQLALEIRVALLVAPLEPGMEDDVRERPAPQPVAEREDVAELLRSDPVDRAAQPRLERHALPRLEQERVEEEHAELPVAGPGLALSKLLEAADVDEHRLRALELDVVWARVLQNQPLLDRASQQLELQQRGVAQHREGPLVGIRDERDAVVLEHRSDATVERFRHVGLDLAGADDLGVQFLQEPGGRERAPVGEAPLTEQAEDPAVRGEDPAVRITKRAWFESGDRAGNAGHAPIAERTGRAAARPPRRAAAFER